MVGTYFDLTPELMDCQRYCGGTWKGIEKKVWPCFQNIRGDADDIIVGLYPRNGIHGHLDYSHHYSDGGNYF